MVYAASHSIDMALSCSRRVLHIADGSLHLPSWTVTASMPYTLVDVMNYTDATHGMQSGMPE